MVELIVGARYIHEDDFDRYQHYRIIDDLSEDKQLVRYTAYDALTGAPFLKKEVSAERFLRQTKLLGE